jgi:diguanylate cyclase (GGDEF)-like protein
MMMLSPASLPVVPSPDSVLTTGVVPPVITGVVGAWARERGLFLRSASPDAVERAALQASLPAAVILGVEGDRAGIANALRTLKRAGRLQSVPAVVALATGTVEEWLAEGADEVITAAMGAGEIVSRLDASLRRSRRDVQVNPSTRLPGNDSISQAISERLDEGQVFAACYADLDHFKEFNDRYGYAHGDDVIRSVAALLVEVVSGLTGEEGFVGHIGGDDFLFLVPLSAAAAVCDTIVRRADEMLPVRYSPHDRQAGYFFGKDRRGRLDKVPLMTLSIGAVSNERRRFTNAAQVSELATEMKTYAKTLSGSVWAMDRRSDSDSANPPEETL